MRRQLIPLTIVALFVLGTLASAAPATNTQINAAQAVLDNEGPLGDDVLQGEWETRNEHHRLYLRGGNNVNYAAGGGCGNFNSARGETVLFNARNVDPDTIPAEVLGTYETATWDISTVTNEFTMTQFNARLFFGSGGNADIEVALMDGDQVLRSTIVEFNGLITENLGENQHIATVLTPIGYDTTVQTERTVVLVDAQNPLTVQEGAELGLRFTAVAGSALTDVIDTELFYGCNGSPSHIDIYGNTARVNMWTETFQGVATTEFPTAQDAPSEDRIVRTQVVHVNALGVTPAGRDPVDQHTSILTIYDKDGNDRTGISDVRINNRIDRAKAPGMEFWEYVVQYPDTMLDQDLLPYDGPLFLEITGARGQSWAVDHRISIGGAQVELDLAQFEDATKTILVGEPTTFLFTLRNGGLVQDDVVITGNELNGWSVNAFVNSINLAPGESRTFPITIEPPASAVSGDFQSFDISAVSSRTGRTDTETVTVILTNIESDGVEILGDLLETVKISAGQTKSVALTIKNTGNSAEDFALSTAGVPLGWKAKLSPSSTELGAKSQSGTLLSVTAPADAEQGEAFGLTVTVRSIVDNTIKDIIIVPFEVFFREDFTIGVAHGVVNGEFQVHQTTLGELQAFPDSGSIVPAPGIHVLRDEGPDDNSVDTCDTRLTVIIRIDPGCTSTHHPGPWDGIGDSDIDYDQSALFRVVLTNHGDREDTIRLRPSTVFDSAWESRDGFECEDSQRASGADNFPDGWRIRYWEADTVPTQGSLAAKGQNPHDDDKGNLRLPVLIQTVDLEPGETKFVWVEMGWRDVDRLDGPDNDTGGTSCRGGDQGPGDDGRESPATKNLAVKFIAESLRDLTKVEELYLRTHYERNVGQQRDGSQRYSDQFNQVYLGIDDATYSNPDDVRHRNTFQVTGNEAQRTATYHLRAVNGGNEMDKIRIEVPLENDQFEYTFSNIDTRAAFNNFADHSHKSGRVAGCDPQVRDDFIECTLGAFDEIAFQVNVIAKDDTVPIGQLHSFGVRAVSLDSLQKAGAASVSPILLEALGTGTHAFAITEPVVADGIHDVDVYPGQSVKVPFVIQNQGTSFDNYQVDFLEAPPEGSDWEAIIGFNSPQFIASGKDHVGFVTLFAPDDATAGESETVRVRVASLDGTGVPQRTLRIQANVIATPTNIEIVPDPQEVVGFPGLTADLTFKATRTGGLATSVDFALDEDSLPSGWSVVGDATPAAVDYDLAGKAEHTFTIQIPDEALGSSRVPITVTGTDSNDNAHTVQAVISMDSSAFGVHLSSPQDFSAETITTNVVAGSKVEVPVRVQNLGGGIDQIALDTEPLAPGWQVTFSEGSPEPASFQPFEARTIIATIVAPEGVPAGDGIDVVLIGTSVGDVTRTDNLVIEVRTGQSILEVGTPTAPTRYVAPFEEVVYAYSVLNNGTVRDEITFTAGLSTAYQDLIAVKFSPESAILGPGESASVTARLTVPEGFLPNAVIPIKLEATSDGPLLNAFGEAPVEVRVLDHRVLDIDNDGNPEYAVDRNRDGSDGFEEFTDPVATGKPSVSIDMTQFLTPEAIEDWTVLMTENETTFERFTFVFDLTGDGRIDHFVDDDQDNIPDTFWDPRTGGRDDLDTTFDVTGDGVREYFVDVNSDGLLDVWYDITTGLVGVLLKLDVDGDDVVDFVVDLDRDGAHDDSEPVLFGKDGKITKITQSLDVNGDGRPDLVVDEDGDGIPDHFVPAGKTRGVDIVLEDVTGDGVEDWTYDANNDGRRDSYYDPVTGETGSIDTGSEFIDGLGRYWYVPTLFALVTVLFVVLVVVTRR